MPAERFLITGALGCVGAWVVRELTREGVAAVTFDAGGDEYRLRYLLSEDELAGVTRLRGDVADLEGMRAAIVDHAITHVVHLAALQVPFCAADPSRGALVNVVGTINVFEAVKGTPAAENPVVYSSSIAAYAADDDPMPGRSDPSGRPATHYGVYKFANEGNARIFARDGGLASVGLRPSIVYGVGRDQGITSTPTAAMLAAVRGEPFRISFSGPCQMQYAPDVASAFIAAARSEPEGAAVFNVGGPTVDVAEIVEAIRRVEPEAGARIEHDGDPLPFPASTPPDGLAERLGEARMTPLAEGVAETMAHFRRLIDLGLLPEVPLSSPPPLAYD